MPKRYFTLRRPRQAQIADDPDAENYLTRTVYETDPTPYETGILDQFGEPLWATYELDQIGFIRRET